MSFTAPEMIQDAPPLSQMRVPREWGMKPPKQPASQGRKDIFKRSNLEPEHICSPSAHSTAWQTRRDGSQSLTGCQVPQMMELKIARYR